MMEFKNFILSNEEILMDKILKYAKDQGYTKYTSTLKEAWRLSISGLSEALIKVMEKTDQIPEMGPDDDFTKSEIAEFGIIEAKKHRSRGITLGMFLGLMKYYQQAYIDLLKESKFSKERIEFFSRYLKRFFDHVELGFTIEWASLSKNNEIAELQDLNRSMTNEKNKYLTVFESIYDPIILINKDNKIENVNLRAEEEFFGDSVSGKRYYDKINTDIELDWLKEAVLQFSGQKKEEALMEKAIHTYSGLKSYLIKFKKMLDISEKYSGTVIIFYDITDRKKFEKELKLQYNKLEVLAYSDPMTGVANRRTGLMQLEKELSSLYINHSILSVCFIDIDGLKYVNDSYGHSEGDSLIKNIVSGIKSTVPPTVTFSRMGGDEFLLIFPGCKESQAEEIIKKVREYLMKYDLKMIKPYQHSFSYGIQEIACTNILNADQVLKNVDEKMYSNKNIKKLENMEYVAFKRLD